MELDHKVVAITGGASGIGRACALAMAGRGADVVIADVNEERIESTVAEIRGLGRRALGMRCDVGSDDDVGRLATTAIREFSGVDLLMNNAGVLLGGRVESVTIADWEWIIGINVLGPVRGVRAFLPHMLERGSGYIVNTASFAGLVASNPLTIPYSTSKYAVVGFSAGLALYAKPKGIGVTVVCPSFVDTHFAEQYRLDATTTTTGLAVGPSGASPTTAGERPMQASELAEKVVAAVESDRFMVFSRDEDAALLLRRTQDIDRHIARQIAYLSRQS